MDDLGIRTRAQLLAEGVAGSTIDHRCKRGIYHRVLPGVYSLLPPNAYLRCAAMLAWEPKAVLSHRTAAWLHGMLPEPAILEATVPKPIARRPPAWLRLYRRDLELDCLADVRGLRTVVTEQAVIDCLAVLPRPEADALIDRQLSIAFGAEELRLLVKQRPGRRGNGGVDRQLRMAAVNFASEPERVLARAFAARGFRIEPNAPVGPFVGDFVDGRARLVVEVDGREFHSEPKVFRQDRRRQNWMLTRGWLVLRYAAWDVLENPDAVADEVIRIARRRRKALG
jgi:very-short-patch-repair endonuclease